MSQTRRLAAILAADVAGYSRLIEADEEGTLGRLRALRAEIIDPEIDGHRRRIPGLTRGPDHRQRAPGRVSERCRLLCARQLCTPPT